MFTDGVFGGKQKALNAAIKFKTGILAGISEYKYYIRIRSKVRKNNRSGIFGVVGVMNPFKMLRRAEKLLSGRHFGMMRTEEGVPANFMFLVMGSMKQKDWQF